MTIEAGTRGIKNVWGWGPKEGGGRGGGDEKCPAVFLFFSLDPRLKLVRLSPVAEEKKRNYKPVSMALITLLLS